MRCSATGGTLPFSLCERDAILNGETPDGVNVTFHSEDRFSDVKTQDGEYLQSWYEILPDEVLNNTAPAGSVPLILALHGMGDDPLMFADENGYIKLAGDKRVAVVSPQHQEVFWTMKDGQFVEGIECEIMPKFVRSLLETYPALDASRVYVTGYSMGGFATMKTIHGDPALFAAAVPMSGMGYTPTDEQAAQFDKVDLPILFTTSTRDLSVVFDEAAGHIGTSHQTQIQLFLKYNGMNNFTAYDFDQYPMAGFKADSGLTVTLNGEFVNHRWFLNNADGVPMVGLGITEGFVHSLYPEFAKIMWDFASHYSRNTKTGAVVYHP
jgi:poly(3-hydroxybutyrate) depolymerase